MTKIIHVGLHNFAQEVLQSNKPVLVDFYSPGCGPCRLQTPVLEELAVEHPNVKVVKLDVSEEPELALQFKVIAVPTLLVFRSGQVVKSARGLQDKRRLVKLLEE